MNGAVSLNPSGALMLAHETEHLDDLVDVDHPARGRDRHPLARELYVAHMAIDEGDREHAAEMLRRAADHLDPDVEGETFAQEVSER